MRYTWVLFLKDKSHAVSRLDELISYVSDHGQIMKAHNDGGAEFISQALKDIVYSRHKIKRELTTANP